MIIKVLVLIVCATLVATAPPSVPTTSKNPADNFHYAVGYVSRDANVAVTEGDYIVEPENMDLSAYTDVVFSSALVNAQHKLDFYEPEPDRNLLRRLIDHASTKYTDINVLISVDIPSVDEQVAGPLMLASKSHRRTFILSALEALAEYKAAGIELFFDFPSTDDEDLFEAYAKNLVLLVREMRGVFSQNYTLSIVLPAINNPGIRVPSGASWTVFLDKISAMSPFVDYIAFMANGRTPVQASPSKMHPAFDIGDMSNAVETIINLGFAREKLLLGLPFFGQVYAQLDKSVRITQSPYSFPVFEKSEEYPYIIFREIIESFEGASVEASEFVDTSSLTDVVTFDHDNWITYIGVDNMLKRVRFAKSLGIGGVVAFYINCDDNQYSLSKAILSGMI